METLQFVVTNLLTIGLVGLGLWFIWQAITGRCGR